MSLHEQCTTNRLAIVLGHSLADHAAEVADRIFGPLRKPLPDLVRAMSEIYTRDRSRIGQATGRDVLQARLRFFLPRDLPKIMFPLAELHAADRLPQGENWRVLDLGAGFGTTSLGTSLFAAHTGAAESLTVDAWDTIGKALEGFKQLAPRVGGVPIRLRTFTKDVRGVGTRERYDLILLGLVLNELSAADALALMTRLRGKLAPGGSIIVLEPALRDVTRRLMTLRDTLADDGWNVLAPCPHQGPCPMLAKPKDWCHEERSFALPEDLAKVARAAGLRWERSTFAYLTLAAPPSLADVVLAGDAVKLRVVSSRLVSKGKLELVTCGSDGALVRTMRLDRHADDCNAAFGHARRGDLLRLDPARPGRIQAGEQVVRWTLPELP